MGLLAKIIAIDLVVWFTVLALAIWLGCPFWWMRLTLANVAVIVVNVVGTIAVTTR